MASSNSWVWSIYSYMPSVISRVSAKLIRKFGLLSLVYLGLHGHDIFVREIPEDGDRCHIFKLPFGLHDVHDDVRGLVKHALLDEFVRQEEQSADIRLLASIRVGRQFPVIFEAFASENPLELQIFEEIVTLVLGESQVQLVGHKEEGCSLSDHYGTRFLVPDHLYLSHLIRWRNAGFLH